MSADWYYSTGGAQRGPITLDELKTLIRAQSIARETLVWKEGMQAWTPAGQVAELFAVPPPLPTAQPAQPAPAPLPPPQITPVKAPARRSTRLAFEDATPTAASTQQLERAPTKPKFTAPTTSAPPPPAEPDQGQAPSATPQVNAAPRPPSLLWILGGLVACTAGWILGIYLPLTSIMGFIAAASVVGWFLHRSWATLPAAHRSIQPRSAVLLTLIPVVNVYGIRRAVCGLTIATHAAVLKKRPMTARSKLATLAPWLCVISQYGALLTMGVGGGIHAPLLGYLGAVVLTLATITLPLAFGFWALEQTRLAQILADVPLEFKWPSYLKKAHLALTAVLLLMLIPHLSLPYLGPAVPVIVRPVCLKCGGTGRAGRCNYCQGYGQQMGVKCAYCNGTGQAPCSVCAGTGLGPGHEEWLGHPPFTEIQAYVALTTYVEAQDIYRRTDWDNDRVKEYAQNGRGANSFYETAPMKADIALIDQAFADALASPGQIEKDGYFFKILHRQGPNALGGAREFIVNGNMTQGHAMLAYPAHYGITGVNSYMVNAMGDIYYKDLGPETDSSAGSIDSFNPDPTWQKPAEISEGVYEHMNR